MRTPCKRPLRLALRRLTIRIRRTTKRIRSSKACERFKILRNGKQQRSKQHKDFNSLDNQCRRVGTMRGYKRSKHTSACISKSWRMQRQSKIQRKPQRKRSKHKQERRKTLQKFKD